MRYVPLAPFKMEALDLKYFKPKASTLDHHEWDDTCEQMLLQGISAYGAGDIERIRRDYLPRWDSIEIRLKLCTLFGRQDISVYKSFKGNARQIYAERQKNKNRGRENGLWHYGMLVSKSHGDLLQEDASPMQMPMPSSGVYTVSARWEGKLFAGWVDFGVKDLDKTLECLNFISTVVVALLKKLCGSMRMKSKEILPKTVIAEKPTNIHFVADEEVEDVAVSKSFPQKFSLRQ